MMSSPQQWRFFTGWRKPVRGADRIREWWGQVVHALAALMIETSARRLGRTLYRATMLEVHRLAAGRDPYRWPGIGLDESPQRAPPPSMGRTRDDWLIYRDQRLRADHQRLRELLQAMYAEERR